MQHVSRTGPVSLRARPPECVFARGRLAKVALLLSPWCWNNLICVAVCDCSFILPTT